MSRRVLPPSAGRRGLARITAATRPGATAHNAVAGRITPAATATGSASAPAGRLRRGPWRSSDPDDGVPAHALVEVVAALVDAGTAPSTALELVSEGLRTSGDVRADVWSDLAARAAGGVPPRPVAPSTPWSRGGDVGPGQVAEDVGEVLALAVRYGLPPGDLLRASAARARRRSAERSGRRIGRLPVLLVLPTGLCLLPAALLLGVVPVVIGLLSALQP